MQSATTVIPTTEIFEADSVIIYQPRYADATQSKIKAIVETPDGRFVEVTADVQDRRNPLVRDIFLQFTNEEIALFTRREREILEQKERVLSQQADDERIAHERELTFQAKAKALELEEVRNCKDPRVAQKIRKARSPFEVTGWIAVAFALSLEATKEQ